MNIKNALRDECISLFMRIFSPYRIQTKNKSFDMIQINKGVDKK
ncbi:hypothetical protein lbkm_3540 [Lachnospiraceae bacterium KM106-2]|nr:hypothetical protein lbkm_3540 [Lachnospiraceae bacterium KM106-2]